MRPSPSRVIPDLSDALKRIEDQEKEIADFETVIAANRQIGKPLPDLEEYAAHLKGMTQVARRVIENASKKVT